MRRAWLALAVVTLACIGCERGFDFERMRNQHRPAMRLPPAGTVPRGEDENEAQPATTQELAVRGGRQFQISCAICHGADASGRSLMSSNLPGTAPPPLDGGHAKTMTDTELFAVISRGRNHMPAFAWALTAADRWAVVAYVRALQSSR